ncbi:DUF4139 domain-containing protein [uncultured Sphingomonas sp.]|uniref:DUF4139 domain-containing protein n=1 Tax=uncultured Sphingomonas sp. TaxID=158754 RepID=UPI0035CC5F76
MIRLVWPIVLLALFAPATLAAQAVVVSARPDDVSVTVYRAANRAGNEIDRGDPAGIALITERRTVALPAGAAVIRFEGVAGNILPESAVVADLPSGVVEKNLDADLLSPRSLYDRTLGRAVMVRRTDRATGKMVEQAATIRSSADGAALVTFAGGTEALRCTGLAEAIVYPAVPAGLSDKPTLSVRTDSPRATTATLTLSYLATGFDWQADYVVTLRADGRAADLFAWVTLASSDVTSFPRAQAAAVAGKVNRVDSDDSPALAIDRDRSLTLNCFPTGADYGMHPPPPPPPPPPPAPSAPEARMAQDIIVTVARMAKQEELGDLKLYRFPDRVDVAAKSQKQVAFLSRRGVAMRAVYVSEVSYGNADDPRLVLRATNTSAGGLGAPLPAGQVEIFQEGGGRPLLIGEARTDDKAVGEDVEYRLNAGPGVSVQVADRPARRDADGHRLTVTNANPWPIAFEARLGTGDDQHLRFKRPLRRKDNRFVWAATVPANGTATFDYEVVGSD